MKIVKKITIVAVLIASVILIYTFVNDAYEERKAHEKVKQGFLDQMEQSKAMERRNNKTAEEKCEEARENIKNYEVEARDLKEDNPDEEWVDHSIFKIKHSLMEVEQALCKG